MQSNISPSWMQPLENQGSGCCFFVSSSFVQNDNDTIFIC